MYVYIYMYIFVCVYLNKSIHTYIYIMQRPNGRACARTHQSADVKVSCYKIFGLTHKKTNSAFRLFKRCIWHRYLPIQDYGIHKTGYISIEYPFFCALRIQHLGPADVEVGRYKIFMKWTLLDARTDHIVTETPAGISAAPLRYRHIPLSGAPGRQARRLTRSDGRARERQAGRLLPAPACVCSARRGCHSCDAYSLQARPLLRHRPFSWFPQECTEYSFPPSPLYCHTIFVVENLLRHRPSSWFPQECAVCSFPSSPPCIAILDL